MVFGEWWGGEVESEEVLCSMLRMVLGTEAVVKEKGCSDKGRILQVQLNKLIRTKRVLEVDWIVDEGWRGMSFYKATRLKRLIGFSAIAINYDLEHSI